MPEIHVFDDDPAMLDLYLYLHTYDFEQATDLPKEQEDRVRWAIQQYNMIYQKNFEPQDAARNYEVWKKAVKTKGGPGFNFKVASFKSTD